MHSNDPNRTFRRPARCPGAFSGASTRRELLQSASTGFGWLAFSGLAAGATVAQSDMPGAMPGHMRSRAKNVILCFMDGGPSHVDTFDPKPMLKQHEGKSIGDQAVSKLSQSAAGRVWFGSPWNFRQHGQSGLWVSDLLPHIARYSDDLCVVRSLVGRQPLHGQQNLLMHTGRVTGGAPSFGSWVSYGLGAETQNLPAYVLLNNDWIPNGGFENFSSAFLPATNSATMLRARGEAVDNIQSPDSAVLQRHKLTVLQQQDLRFSARQQHHMAIESAIRNYETAFRMQTAVPEVADVSGETQATQEAYGINSSNEYQKYYGLQCLRARRLVEAGVRFVEITCPLTHANNSPWDQHGQLVKHHNENALITDQSVGALIGDLKQRGLLDETIVIWAGEMGRTPHTPSIHPGCGRDHHVNGYSIFLAGGGFRGGMTYGMTDEFGNSVVENESTIHDIHATVLHQLGLDHERLIFQYGGRDVSLTDVHGTVLKDILS